MEDLKEDSFVCLSVLSPWGQRTIHAHAHLSTILFQIHLVGTSCKFQVQWWTVRISKCVRHTSSFEVSLVEETDNCMGVGEEHCKKNTLENKNSRLTSMCSFNSSFPQAKLPLAFFV